MGRRKRGKEHPLLRGPVLRFPRVGAGGHAGGHQARGLNLSLSPLSLKSPRGTSWPFLSLQTMPRSRRESCPPRPPSPRGGQKQPVPRAWLSPRLRDLWLNEEAPQGPATLQPGRSHHLCLRQAEPHTHPLTVHP